MESGGPCSLHWVFPPSAPARIVAQSLLLGHATYGFASVPVPSGQCWSSHRGMLWKPHDIHLDNLKEFRRARFSVDKTAINAHLEIAIPFVSEADAAMSDADETRPHKHRALPAAMLQATDYCFLAD